jgi:hypothetical protein
MRTEDAFPAAVSLFRTRLFQEGKTIGNDLFILLPGV